MCLPVLIGLGAKLSARAERQRLQAAHDVLDAENASYRSATDEFTAQIRSLAGVVNELQSDGARVSLSGPRPPARDVTAPAGDHAPSMLVSALLTPSFSSPDEIYDVLRDVLQTLTNRLPSIERGVRGREALGAATPAIWPSEGWLTASFGTRSDPFSGERGFHQGIDISTPEGQPVHATGDGVVESATYAGDYGNLVVIQHGFGLSTRYGHLSRFAVTAGATLKRGDVVGFVGATGRATGAHLHYEILVNSAPIDPLRILTAPPIPSKTPR
jgi:murein DD-endopeptidase MepM/ murein hydrolase activator NlpD